MTWRKYRISSLVHDTQRLNYSNARFLASGQQPTYGATKLLRLLHLETVLHDDIYFNKVKLYRIFQTEQTR
jgi:hypothetical protein